MLPSYSVNVSGGIVSTHPQCFIVVRDKDIHPTNIVFNAGTASVLNGVHDAVDHDLGSKGIGAGHGDHTNCHSLAAGCNALGIGTAASGAGTVMGHIDLQGVKRLTVGGASNLLVKVHILGSAKGQSPFITGRIQMDTDTAFRMDPFAATVLTVSGKNKYMVQPEPPSFIRKPKSPGKSSDLSIA